MRTTPNIEMAPYQGDIPEPQDPDTSTSPEVPETSTATIVLESNDTIHIQLDDEFGDDYTNSR